MSKELEAIQELENDPDVTIYYTYDNRPDYAVNSETGEITIFQYGYFGHTDGMTMNDIDPVDCDGNVDKKAVFDELDNRIEKLIDDYNRAKAHNYHASNDSTYGEYKYVKGQLDALMDLREELTNDYYW